MTNKYRLPIWDWSDDGHGKCEWYTVESECDIVEMKEAYDLINSKLNISSIAQEYQENFISKDTLKNLEKFWIATKDWLISGEVDGEAGGIYIQDSEDLAKLIVLVINIIHPNSTKLIKNNYSDIMCWDLPWYWLFE